MGSNESDIDVLFYKKSYAKKLRIGKSWGRGGGVALILTLPSPGDRVEMERRQRLLCLLTHQNAPKLTPLDPISWSLCCEQ